MPIITEDFFRGGGQHKAHVGRFHLVLYWEPYYDQHSKAIEKAFTVDVLEHANVVLRKRFADLFEAMTFITIKERELSIQIMAEALLNP